MIQFTGRRSRRASIKEFHEGDAYGLGDFKSNEIDSFLDIGANVGFVSIQARVFYRHAKIYALEPSSYTMEFLKKNIKHLRIQYHQMALGNGETFYLYHPNVSLKNMFVEEDGEENDEAKEECQSFTINQIFEKFNLPTDSTFVKIDCEGGEAFLMEQDPELLKKCKRIAMETHTRAVDYAMREWTTEVFSDTHVIDVRKKQYRNLNMYILTRKDCVK